MLGPAPAKYGFEVTEPASTPADVLSTDPAIGPPMLDRETIAARIRELGEQIAVDYAGKSPLLICVLRGAYVFMTDLAREIDLPLDVDFIAVSSAALRPARPPAWKCAHSWRGRPPIWRR